MNERAMAVGALGLGAITVVGLGLLSSNRNSLASKVTFVRVLSPTKRSPAYVEIGVEPSAALLRRVSEGEACEYQVAEPEGRIYPLVPSSDEHARVLRVPYEYGRAPTHPQVEVWLDGERRASTPILSMPPPVVTPLTISPEKPLRAFHISSKEAKTLSREKWNLMGGIRFEPSRSLQPHERWQIAVLETPFRAQSINRVGDAAATCQAAPIVADASGLQSDPTIARLFYAEDVTTVRVAIRRVLRRTVRRTVVLSGLRLVKNKGQTSLIWNGTTLSVPADVEVRAAQLDPGGVIKSSELPASAAFVDSDGDRRAVLLRLVIQAPAITGKTKEAGGLGASSSPQGLGKGSAFTAAYLLPYSASWPQLSFEEAIVKRLNIRRLRIECAGKEFSPWEVGEYRQVSGLVSSNPFNLSLTMTKEWDQVLGSSEATIRVEAAPPN